ncbi:hypothetical protein BV25DRAFT_1818425 [Artomyces pyxidatus]|uniref:Uncharacterized protein n=1 Tax=Artomyces pyxidatus TaxID=48021 RepID=A0ACB8THX1_9AGAM|nr:hypothetical protein BV25DRAFT_1818425 [Artomyces pyxidatus]
MADETTKLKNRLATLLGSLEDLESELEPLFTQSLPESVLGLDTVQQAKLQVVLPYLVYDLVFIYLKTRGIDPKTHPVVAELDRVRQYFDKIKAAEAPAAPKMSLDKAAATRFIKHAIAQVSYGSAPAQEEEVQDAPRVPSRVTEKMVERERYLEAVRAAGSESEGEGLHVIDGEEDEDEDSTPPSMPSTGRVDRKGKGKATEPADAPGAGGKRRRAAMDPFAGYGEEASPRSTPPSAPKKSKKSESSAADAGSTDVLMDDVPAPRPTAEGVEKKAKKLGKKKKRPLPISG